MLYKVIIYLHIYEIICNTTLYTHTHINRILTHRILLVNYGCFEIKISQLIFLNETI